MGAEAGGIHFKNGRSGHKPRNMGDLRKLENVRKQVLPRASFQKEHISAHTLIFNSVRPSMDFQPPDQKNKLMLFYATEFVVVL